MKLGQLELSSRFLLAPLESVTDCAFRQLCASLGAGFTWTEMVRARGIVRNNKSTLDLVDTFDADVPTGLQLLVVNEGELEEALGRIDALSTSSTPHFRNVRAVDLNFGCPSPEVIKIGAGPALLKRKVKLRAIFERLKAWKARTALPIGAITAKIRLGLNRPELDQRVYLPIVELASELLDGLIVHARHAREASTDPARWQAIAECKQKARIPIIGNGDALDAASAKRMMQETGCDGVLIARGAIRSPWVFRALAGRGPGLPSMEEIDVAERAWTERAKQLQSKPKYFEWHAEGFRRMRARVEGRDDGGSLPPNDNLR